MNDQELKKILRNAGITEDELDEMLDAYYDPNSARHHEAIEIVNNYG